MDISLSDKKIKVLHVRSTIGMYGAEQVLLNVLPELDLRCDITLITLESDFPESAMLRALVSSVGVEVYGFETKRRIDSVVIESVKSRLEKSEIDVIHTHDYKSLFYIYSIAKKMNIPVIHHVHGALGNTFNERIYGLVEKWMMRKVSKILTVSQDQKKNLDNNFIPYPEIKQINNGTVVKCLDDYKENNRAVLNLIMVARFTEEKNHLMALELVSKLKENNISVVLTLLGDGPLKGDIKKSIEFLGIKDCVNLVGFTQEVGMWLAQSDVLLITSKTEGMPLNMLEAMERGLPVISTSVGEIPRIIQAASCGKTFSKLDELLEIIDAINSNRVLWKEIGHSGRLYIKNNLSIEKQSESIYMEYLDVFQSGVKINSFS